MVDDQNFERRFARLEFETVTGDGVVDGAGGFGGSIGGRARRQMQAQAAAVASAGIAAWMVEGALRYLGVSFEVVYGVYGPTVPLIALAAASTGFAAARGRWPELGLAIVIMLIAAGSTFFGPKGAWGLTGLGCAIALLLYAAVLRTRLRRPVPS